MREEAFRVVVGDGAVHGHHAGAGSLALVLHGGAAVTDYMDGCVDELVGVFRTIRYPQRGTFPSEVGPPYTIEAHVSDAVDLPWLERPGELRRAVESFLVG